MRRLPPRGTAQRAGIMAPRFLLSARDVLKLQSRRPSDRRAAKVCSAPRLRRRRPGSGRRLVESTEACANASLRRCYVAQHTGAYPQDADAWRNTAKDHLPQLKGYLRGKIKGFESP